MRVLVTGACGFVSAGIVRKVRRMWPEILRAPADE